MGVRHRSPIWKIPTEDLIALVNRSSTFTEVLAYFGLKMHGGNNQTLKERLAFDGIDCTGLSKRRKQHRQKQGKSRGRSLTEILADPKSRRKDVKRAVLEAQVLPPSCAVCGGGDTWEGKPLTLVLDHINGVNNDHRVENLRLLCPNCNSQTQTFAGRNLRKERNCQDCGIQTKKGSCRRCAGLKRRKPLAISDEELETLVWEKPVSQIAKELGISDVALAKRCRRRGIERPGRGYWAKQQAK